VVERFQAVFHWWPYWCHLISALHAAQNSEGHLCGRGTTGLVNRLSLQNRGWQWAGVMSASRPHEREVYARCKPCKVNLHFFTLRPRPS